MALSSYWRSALDPERVMHVEVGHWQEHDCLRRDDQLTVEEPFEIQIAGRSLAVIMRTPGHDRELAMGFLFSERVIQAASDVVRVEDALDKDGLPLVNVVNVTLRDMGWQETSCALSGSFERHFAVSASCGLCGKTSIAGLLSETTPLDGDVPRVSAETFYLLDAQLRAQQKVFDYTGGLHAAGLFSCSGELLLLREDVGRHNAVDKLVGYGLLYGLHPYQEHILLVSGRTSFEIVQKALLARIPYIASISAPSSMAVELADKAGITLIGFLRGRSMNVYTHAERLLSL
jgi:FdhD protein